MQNRILALLVTLVSILNFGGCDTDDPVVPVEVQTDYDFVVVNETAIDFVVYRKSSINGYVWELMDPLGGLSEVPYRSEIDATYLLFFCREGDAPEDRYAGVNYGYSTTDTQTWVLRVREPLTPLVPPAAVANVKAPLLVVAP